MYRKKQNPVKKFHKKFNTRMITSKKSYSINEIAALLSIHPITVNHWFKKGLKKIDDKRPSLVFGQDLIDFLDVKKQKSKHPCEDNQLFCVKCQQPRQSRNNTVCIKISNSRTNMKGSCEKCGTKINKAISPKKIDLYQKILTVVEIHTKDLIECANSCTIVK
jgi:hypothetical protein